MSMESLSKLTQIRNRLNSNLAIEIKNEKEWIENADLWEVKNFWKATVTKLFEEWITSKSKLLETPIEKIKSLFTNRIVLNAYNNFINNNK